MDAGLRQSVGVEFSAPQRQIGTFYPEGVDTLGRSVSAFGAVRDCGRCAMTALTGKALDVARARAQADVRSLRKRKSELDEASIDLRYFGRFRSWLRHRRGWVIGEID